MAAVFKHTTATLLSTGSSYFSFTPRATTSWRCWQISAWQVPAIWQSNNSTPGSIGIFFLEKAQSSIAEFRLGFAYQDMRWASIIIPFGDGISFSGSEQIRVRATPEQGSTARYSSTMIGEE